MRDNGHLDDNGDLGSDWRDPDWSLLDDRRGNLPDFPTEALTAPWRTWLKKASHGAGVTPAHIMVPLLGIGASLIGAARRVRPSRSWSESLTLWTSVIGFSGTGKTPGLDVSRRALSAIDRSRKHELAELLGAYRARVGVAKAFAKKWTKQAEEAVAGGNPAPAMPEQAIVPAEFTAPRLFVSNVTIERLAALVQARPRGMLWCAMSWRGCSST